MVTAPAAQPQPTMPPVGVSSWRQTWTLLYRAGVAWDKDNAMRLAAAVAMYAILSLSPMLVITIKGLTLVLGQEAATQLIHRQVEGFLGPAGEQTVQSMITDTVKPDAGILASIISLAVVLFTASGVFYELRGSLNAIWNVAPKPQGGLLASLRKRALAFGMVLVLGALLLATMVFSTALIVVSEYLPGESSWFAVVIDIVASTLVVTILFGMIFRFLPDVRLTWREVLFGSLVTAVLFKLGQYAQALYFTYGSTASTYGAAGTFVVVLLWIYYSCWILFYGAELIQEHARMNGREIVPDDTAMRLPEHTFDSPEAATAIAKTTSPAEEVAQATEARLQ